MVNTNTKKISRDIMKNYNQKLLLRILKDKGAVSKSELSKSTGLTLPGVTDILEGLEGLNLIKNIGESRTVRGRFPTLYQLNENSFKVIDVTIRSESLKVDIFDI